VDGDAGVEGLRIDELERGLVGGVVGEEAPAAAEHDREDHQPVHVDQVVLEQLGPSERARFIGER
jgi:hypothetical protein